MAVVQMHFDSGLCALIQWPMCTVTLVHVHCGSGLCAL